MSINHKPWPLKQIEPYVHVQNIESHDVTIEHLKGKPCPPVVLIDSDGDQFEAEIRYIDINTIQILTNRDIIFTAYIF